MSYRRLVSNLLRFFLPTAARHLSVGFEKTLEYGEERVAVSMTRKTTQPPGPRNVATVRVGSVTLNAQQ